MTDSFKKIGIFGGSFNPPHLGHVAICRYCLEKEKLDAVWIIPCFQHPFDKPLAPFEHRFKMCELAFEEFGDKVGILDTEEKLGGKSYTYRTIKHLKKQKRPCKLILILGHDTALEALKWKDYEKLKKEIEWFVLPRGTNSPIPDIHATDVRKILSMGRNPKSFTSENVFQYIIRNGLYLK